MPLIDSYDKLILQNESVTLPNKGIYFNGSTDYLTLVDSADWDFSGGVWTIDCWVYFSDLSDTRTIFAQRTDANNFMYLRGASNGSLGFSSYASAWKTPLGTSAGAISTNQWYHIEVGENGNNYYFFINGILVDSINTTDRLADYTSVFRIGSYDGSNYMFLGYIREFRISNGIIRHTTNFTPSNTPYTADSYTKLLIHPVEMPGATTFLDSETTPKTITTVGSTVLKGCFYDTETTPKVVTAVGSAAVITSKFNKSAGFFNGTTDCILVPSSADFTPGTNFTAECFVMFSTIQTCCLFAILPASGNYGWYIQYQSGVFKFAISYDGTNFAEASKTQTAIVNIWYHILARKNGNTLEIYIDGNIGTNYDFTGRTAYNSTGLLSIGALYQTSGSQQFTAGWIKELRISDVARTATVPTTQYTTDSNTKLLLHFDTPATAPLSPAIAFDGTGDYLTLADSADWNLGTNDFTIEGFINFTSLPSNGTTKFLFGQSTDANNFFDACIYNNAGSYELWVVIKEAGNFFNRKGTIPVVVNVWGHFAFVRSATNNWYIFWNGFSLTLSSGGGSLGTETSIANYTGPFIVGDMDRSSGNPINGYLKEFCLSNVALYTTAFTPSQTPFVANSNTKLLIHGNENNGKGENLSTDGGLEIWSSTTSLTNWPETGNGSANRESTTVHDGTYSCKLICTSANKSIRQDKTGWTSKTASAGAWVWCDTPNMAMLAIGDTVIYQNYSSYHPGDSQWHWLTVSGTNDASHDTMRVQAYVIGAGTAYYDSIVLQNGSTVELLTDSEITPKYITVNGDTKIKYIEDYRNTIFLDSETTPKYPYPVGSAKIDFVAPFGTATAWFDGNSDYLSLADHADWAFGNDNFTIDFWIKFNNVTNGQILMTQYISGTQYTQLYVAAGPNCNLYLQAKDSTDRCTYGMTNAWTPQINRWYHLAFIRNGTSGLIFIDGVSQTLTATVAFGTNAWPDLATNLNIGGRTTTLPINGFIDNFRIAKGISRWVTTFNPPSEDFYLSNILKILGVSYSSISKVSSIAKASISKVAGVV